MKKNNVWIPIAMFVVMIFGGMIWSILSPDQSYSDTENRFLASKPEFSWEALFDGEYTQDYETYITDQFPARDTWIGWKTQAEKLLGKVETKEVFLAKDDYLIVNYPASDFEGEQAQKNAGFLAEAASSYTQLLGREHVRILLVPTSSQILTDKLPAYAQPYDQSLYAEKIQATARENLMTAGIGDDEQAAEWVEDIFLDAEQILTAHQDEYIYYRTDHHWTTQGAFYVYQAWANTLGLVPLRNAGLKVVSEEFQGTTYSKLHTAAQNDVISVYDTDTQVTLLHNQQTETEGYYDWSKLEIRDKYAMFLGGNDALLDITKKEAAENGTAENAEPSRESSGSEENTDQQRESVLLVVKDSFANCFIPYAAEHFDRVVVVDLRYLNMSLKQVAEQYGVTDLLVLYNVQAAATDTSVFKITR